MNTHTATIAGFAAFVVVTMGCAEPPSPVTPNTPSVGGGTRESESIESGPDSDGSDTATEVTALSFTGDEFWRLTRLKDPTEARRMDGHDVEIRGQVTKVDLVNGVPQIFIREGGVDPDIEAYDIERFGGRFIALDPQPWAIALPGQQITATGRYEMPDAENDMIRRWGLRPMRIRITSASDDRLVLSATDLAADFLANPEETNEKYNDRWLELRGECVKVEPLPAKSNTHVFLRGRDDFLIRCDFSHTGEEKFADALVAGQEVRIAALYLNHSQQELSLIWSLGITEVEESD